MTAMSGILRLVVVLAAIGVVVVSSVLVQAQDEPSVEPPSWAAKLNTAITDKTGLVLTAEETVAFAQAYAAALNARPGDIAVSNRACYVLALDGTVLLSVPLRTESP